MLLKGVGMVDYKTAKGWLRDDERECLKDLAATAVMLNGTMINIGVEYGASIACLRAGNSAARIIGLDIDMSKLVTEVYEGCEPLLLEGDSGAADIYAKVAQLVGYNHHVTYLVFVDGDHTFAGVMRDTIYANLIDVGGVIIFHDCYDYDHPPQLRVGPSAEVDKAVSTWFMARHKYTWEEQHSVGTMRIFKRLA